MILPGVMRSCGRKVFVRGGAEVSVHDRWGRGKNGAAGKPVTAHGATVCGTRSEKTESVRKERSEGVIDLEVNGRVTPPGLSGKRVGR